VPGGGGGPGANLSELSANGQRAVPQGFLQ
jgi:hypothetical protein